METQTRKNIYLVFWLTFFLQFSANFDISHAFNPSDNYLIGSGSLTDSIVDGRVFVQDRNTDSFLSATPEIFVTDPNPSPDLPLLYHTARVFTKPSFYEFKINSKGTHWVRFHFFPFISANYNLTSAAFHVSTREFLLLSNFRITDKTPVVKEYLIRVNTEKLVIQFTPLTKSSLAFVNAVEVISTPENLIADVARSVTPLRIKNYHGLLEQALETVYRINVGGPKITPFNDSLWRTWVPDEVFLKLKAAAKSISFSGPIMYQRGGASREIAPDHVYNTAQKMNEANVLRPNFNITWIFPVKPGFLYLVRLHFCDIVSSSVNQLYFDIYFNGWSAYKDLDLSHLTNQMLAAPYYIDFVVNPGDSGILVISIGPSALSNPSRINAILNGLEIMKMNNSMGTLDGNLSVNSVLHSGSWKNDGGLIHSALGMIGFIGLFAAFMLLLRTQWTNPKDSVAWSPLPGAVLEGNLKCGNSPSHKSGFLGRFRFLV